MLGSQEEVTSILDWEFAFAGSIYWDIGNFIRYQNIPGFAVCEEGFKRGLESEGMRLPSEWKRIAKLVDLLALCSMLNHEQNGPNRINDLTGLIHRTVHK